MFILLPQSQPAIRLAVSRVSSNRLGAVEVRVDAGINLVQQVAVVGTSGGVRVAAARSGMGASQASAVGVVAASKAGAGSTMSAVATGETRAGVGTVLASTDTTSTSGVASCAVAVRVDARISLVGQVRVVRTSGITVARGAVRASKAGARGAVSVVGACQTSASGTVSVVATSQAGAGVASVLSSTVAASTCSVSGSTQTIRVDARIKFVGQVRVVRTSRVRAVCVT